MNMSVVQVVWTMNCCVGVRRGILGSEALSTGFGDYSVAVRPRIVKCRNETKTVEGASYAGR